MSQIFKPTTGGGGGGVTSVTGTNGVTAAPTTGNVVVSGVNATTSTVGVASFNPADFTVSGAGEVSTINNGTVTSVTGTLPIVVTPASPNPNVSVNLATTSLVGVASFDPADFTVSGAGEVSTIAKPEVWLDEATSFSAVAGDGYFVTGTATASLPVATQGNTIKFIVDGANLLTIQANTGQKIQLGTAISATAGTAVNTGAVTGSTITLVFRAADSIWFGLSSVGTWGIT